MHGRTLARCATHARSHRQKQYGWETSDASIDRVAAELARAPNVSACVDLRASWAPIIAHVACGVISKAAVFWCAPDRTLIVRFWQHVDQTVCERAAGSWMIKRFAGGRREICRCQPKREYHAPRGRAGPSFDMVAEHDLLDTLGRSISTDTES
jgi:hypothetical protein